MTTLIFANGVIDDVEWIRPYVTSASLIIAADGGTRHLFKLDQPPDVLIGDMDSLTKPVQSWLFDKQTQIITHPELKDETDLELALHYAITHSLEKVLLFGASGGRLDQTLANIMILTHPAFEKWHIIILNDRESAWLVSESTEILGQVGDLVSLLPLGDDVQIKKTHGLRWALKNEALVLGTTRGISNDMVADMATIAVANGRLLCVHTRKS